jgi:hypothetical protein
MPVPTPAAIGAPEPRGRNHLGSGPTTIQRYNQARRIFVTADLPPGVSRARRWTRSKLPIMKHLPMGVSNTAYGGDKWQQEMMSTSAAVAAGIMLVFSVLVLLYHRVVSPWSTWGRCSWRLGRAVAAGHCRAADLDVGVHRHPDAVWHCGEKLDPADRLCHRGNAAKPPKFDAIIEAATSAPSPS